MENSYITFKKYFPVKCGSVTMTNGEDFEFYYDENCIGIKQPNEHGDKTLFFNNWDNIIVREVDNNVVIGFEAFDDTEYEIPLENINNELLTEKEKNKIFNYLKNNLTIESDTLDGGDIALIELRLEGKKIWDTFFRVNLSPDILIERKENYKIFSKYFPEVNGGSITADDETVLYVYDTVGIIIDVLTKPNIDFDVIKKVNLGGKTTRAVKYDGGYRMTYDWDELEIKIEDGRVVLYFDDREKLSLYSPVLAKE